uniref:Uncharacterized protein n=1 Tax=Anguilla anguilla TaxID=7936 RepID=A0A0E9Q6B3_ANGAN
MQTTFLTFFIHVTPLYKCGLKISTDVSLWGLNGPGDKHILEKDLQMRCH